MKHLRLLSEIIPWRPSLAGKLNLTTEAFAAVIAALLVIPQGITFAYLAGLPPEYGIYTAIFVTLFASLFGSSSMLGGPNTAVAILIGITVAPFAGRGSPLYIDYVILLSLMVGLIQLLIWLARGGKYFQYLSPAAITGITSGVGIILVLSSLDGIMGLSPSNTLFFFEKLYIMTDDWRELINPYSFTIGAITVIVGVVAKIRFPRFAILIAMAAGYLTGLIVLGIYTQVDTEVELLGHIPFQALPISHPKLDLEYLLVGLAMLPNAITIALIGLAQSMVIVKSLRSDTDQPIDVNKEVFAQGIANLLAAYFSSFAGSGSFNRTALNLELGASTPLAGILSAFTVFILIAIFGPLLSYIPMPVIAGTLMLVGIGMIKPTQIARLFSWTGELLVFVVTLFSIIFLGLQTGLIIAFLLSVILFVLSASKLEINISRVKDSVEVRVEGHLFYASIDQLSSLLKRHRYDSVLLDLSVVSYMDLSATEAIARDLRKRDSNETSFVIVLKSKKLLDHFEQRLEGMPVQFIHNVTDR
ncbi:MAG: SulP family inorganic anion transporter [Candidatus Thiodiazotropha sp.]